MRRQQQLVAGARVRTNALHLIGPGDESPMVRTTFSAIPVLILLSASFLALRIEARAPALARPIEDLCKCELSPEVLPRLPASPACTPSPDFLFNVNVVEYQTSADGTCIDGECTVGKNCFAAGYMRVQTNSGCRIGFSRDGVHIGGGIGDVDLSVSESLECGDFFVYEITLGGIVVAEVNYSCEQCDA